MPEELPFLVLLLPFPDGRSLSAVLLVSRSNLRPSEEGDLRGCCSAGEDEAAALDGEGPPPFVPSREKTLGLPPLGVPLLPLESRLSFAP